MLTPGDFDAILNESGARPCTPEESAMFRAAMERTDAKISRQLFGVAVA
jgi:hypothetical protein